MTDRCDLFISYAREDVDLMHAIRDALCDPRTGRGALVWADSSLRTGDDYARGIEAAIDSARVAILLISRHFAESAFIRDVELPRIRRRHEAGELEIAWVPLDASRSDRALGLHRLHAACSTSRPLGTVDVDTRSHLLPELVRRTYQLIDASGETLRRILLAHGDRFRFEERLGEGRSTIAYRVRDRSLDRSMVVRMCKPEFDRGDFEDELRAAAGVDTHPNIVAVREAWFDADPPCAVLDLLENGTLAQRLQGRGRLGASAVVELLRDLGSALDRVHRAGVYHLDLRPKSILFDRDDTPRILPLNRADRLAGVGTLQAMAEHPAGADDEELAYLLPEAFACLEGDPDKALADQYLLGLVVWQSLTGRTPPSMPLDLLMNQPYVEELQDLPTAASVRADIPVALSDVVERMTRRDPAARFPTLGQALAALDGLDRNRATLVRESYRRMTQHGTLDDAFFRQFYERFLHHLPEEGKALFRPLHESGAWPEHHARLKQAVVHLLAFNALDEGDHEPTVLTRIAERHVGMPIQASWFADFVDALIETIGSHEQALGTTPEQWRALKLAWRKVLEPGMRYLQGGHRAPGDRKRS